MPWSKKESAVKPFSDKKAGKQINRPQFTIIRIFFIDKNR